jgi:predicted phage terminase large subunit-like protein
VSWTLWSKRFRPESDPSAETVLSFRQFVQRANPRYKWTKHTRCLARVIQKSVDGDPKYRRLMIFLPPRHSKSETFSRLATAYYLYRHPERWVGLTSYSAELAYTLSKAARQNYLATGRELDPSMRAIKQWQTTAGGGLWAAGVGGSITGKGFGLGVVDDPFKNAEEASSAARRTKLKEWYQSTFYTRQEEDAIIWLINTRWHEEDLTGQQLADEAREAIDPDGEPEHWHIVNLPAVYEGEEDAERFPSTCTVEPDWRKIGEALWPEKFSVEKLRRIARRIGEYFWSALYQQRPSAKDGSFFQVSKLEIVKAVPVGLRAVRAWDKAAGSNRTNDYTAGVKMVGPDKDGRYYIVDVKRGQWDVSERDATIKQTAATDGKHVTVIGPEDPAQGGKVDSHHFVRLLAGYIIKLVRRSKTTGGKELVAGPLASQLNAGNVCLLQGVWNVPFIEELRQFPGGKNDDQVDGAADAFNELAAGNPFSAATGGKRDDGLPNR